MVKKEIYVGLGLDTDTAPDKRKPDTYYDAENIRIINNARGLSIKPILGETYTNIVFSPLHIHPTDYVKYIVGYTVFMDNIYVFTTTDSGNSPTNIIAHVDDIWKIDSALTSTVIATGRFDFCKGNRIDAVANYETDTIIKLYWVDGYNALRYLNVSTTLGSISRGIDVVDQVTLSTPTVEVESGGSLIAGKVQYCYNLYYQHGSQSNISGVSSLESITDYFKGYESQEITGLKTKITISDIDTEYDAIKVYSIHYQELNQSPKITLIYDASIQGLSSLVLYDDGNLQIAELSMSEFLSISYSPIVPNTLAIKRDRLFVANYTNTNFDPDVDMRAYSYELGETAHVHLINDGGASTLYTNAQLATLVSTHDAINPDFTVHKYKIDGATRGGTGINIEYTFDATPSSAVANEIPPMSLKQGEIYRIGITLYNKYGQASPVKWIADTMIPEYTGTEYIIGIEVKILSAGVTALGAAGVESYQLCIVERKPEDRTILAQGFIVPSVQYIKNSVPMTPYYHPYYITKDLLDPTKTTTGGNIANSYVHDVDYQYDASYGNPSKDTSINFFYSSDTLFETSLLGADYIRFLGVATCNLTSDGAVSLKMWKNNEQIFSTFISPYNTVWSDYSNGFPLHILDQSQTIPYNTADNYVYEVTTNKNYTDILKWDIASRPSDEVFESTEFLKINETKIIDAGATASNAIQIDHLVDDGGAEDLTTSYNASFANSVVLNFDDELWHKVTNDYDKFDVSSILVSGAMDVRAIPIAELIRTVTNQYGGNTYEARQRNEYLKNGYIRTLDTTVNTEYVGDIYVAPLSVNRCEGVDAKNQGVMNIIEYVNLPFMENNHNVYARTDNMYNWKSNLSTTNNYNFFRIEDNHKLLGAYNQKPTLFKGYAVPFNFSITNNYPLSILGSNAKNTNEVLDSWLVYNPNNTKLMEGQYGTITKLHNLNGELIAIQSSGIATLAVEPRIQTQGSDGYQVNLGIGALFYDHRYLTTITGSKDKFTITDDGKNLYYWDSIQNTINTLHEGKLSTLKTVKAILDAYPSGPHTTTFHNKLDQVYFQYNEFTLVYDLLLQKFISKHEFLNSNKWLISNGNSLYQFDESLISYDTRLYTQFTGTVKNSKLVYLMCPESTYEKVFHNLEYRLVGEDFKTIKVTNDLNQDSDTVTPDIKNKFDIHRIHLPRIKNSRERWRGIYIFVELNNTEDFSLDNIVLMYNIKG